MFMGQSWSPSGDESPVGAAADLRGFVEWMASSTKNPPAKALIEHGRVWVGSTLPSRQRRGMAKACFQNAWASASRSVNLVYCEGWAVSGTLGLALPMEHAWLVDIRSGTVIERTWDSDPKRPNFYFGLAVPASTVREAHRRSGDMTTAVLFGDWARNGWFHREGMADSAALTATLP